MCINTSLLVQEGPSEPTFIDNLDVTMCAKSETEMLLTMMERNAKIAARQSSAMSPWLRIRDLPSSLTCGTINTDKFTPATRYQKDITVCFAEHPPGFGTVPPGVGDEVCHRHPYETNGAMYVCESNIHYANALSKELGDRALPGIASSNADT